jgi:hypothetical protein
MVRLQFERVALLVPHYSQFQSGWPTKELAIESNFNSQSGRGLTSGRRCRRHSITGLQRGAHVLELNCATDVKVSVQTGNAVAHSQIYCFPFSTA